MDKHDNINATNRDHVNKPSLPYSARLCRPAAGRRRRSAWAILTVIGLSLSMNTGCFMSKYSNSRAREKGGEYSGETGSGEQIGQITEGLVSILEALLK